MSTILLHGDVRAMLAALKDESVQCVVTSPPYWGLRDYKLEPQVWGDDLKHKHQWEDEHLNLPTGQGGNWAAVYGGATGKNRFKGDIDAARKPKEMVETVRSFCACGAWRGSLGLEPTPELYLEHLVAVFHEVRRVLRKDGTLWLNLGDSYAGSAQGWGHGKQYDVGPKQATNKGSLNQPLTEANIGYDRPPNYISSRQENGLKPKDLVGIPWRVAFALQADGWWLRSDIIWSKPNPMPESVTDRPTKAHEYIFLLTKSARYFYDAEAISEPASHADEAMYDNRAHGVNSRMNQDRDPAHDEARHDKEPVGGILRNRRSVWQIATQPYSGAHFATFPEKLVEPCVLAGSRPGDLVLDPFCGSGTVLVVAQRLGRRAIGIELNADYVQLAHDRLAETTLALPL